MTTAAQAILEAMRYRQQRARQMGEQAGAPLMQIPQILAQAEKLRQEQARAAADLDWRQQTAAATEAHRNAQRQRWAAQDAAAAHRASRERQAEEVAGIARQVASAGPSQPGREVSSILPVPNTLPVMPVVGSIPSRVDIGFRETPPKSEQQQFEERIAGMEFGGPGQISRDQALGIALDAIEKRKRADADESFRERKFDWDQEFGMIKETGRDIRAEDANRARILAGAAQFGAEVGGLLQTAGGGRLLDAAKKRYETIRSEVRADISDLRRQQAEVRRDPYLYDDEQTAEINRLERIIQSKNALLEQARIDFDFDVKALMEDKAPLNARDERRRLLQQKANAVKGYEARGMSTEEAERQVDRDFAGR